eukprot:TRINITY_DN4837_c0_g1_i1.p1 TRINITY_DN4837_c0_g1~~TRINITY_DN4837_c0_g1_i1.p1  ORF type:complete len:1094 (-),score=137.98 TRINITY_DN4837_c0_g1_i1:26-3307(-)
MQSMQSFHDAHPSYDPEDDTTPFLMNINSVENDAVWNRSSSKRCRAPSCRCVLLSVAIALILCTTALTLAIVFGGRAFVNNALESAEMAVDSLQLNATDLSIHLQGHLLHVPSTFGFTVSVVLEGVALRDVGSNAVFATIAEPISLSISPSASSFSIQSKLDVTEEALWTAAGVALLNQRNVTWLLSASATVHVAFIQWANISLIKNVTLEGCNNLSSAVAVTSFDLSDSSASRVVARMNLTIQNPSSQLSMTGLSGLTFALTTPDLKTRVGQISTLGPFDLFSASSSNISLFLHMNSNDIHSQDQHHFISRIISSVLSRESINLTAIGVNCTTPHFQGIVSALRVTAPLGSQTISSNVPPLIQHFSLQGLAVNPINGSAVNVSLSAFLQAASPLGPNCPFEMVELIFDPLHTLLVFQNTSVVGRAVFEPLSNGSFVQQQRGSTLEVNATLSGVLLLVNEDGATTEPEFVEFVRTFLTNNSVSIGVRGWFQAAVCLQALGGCQKPLRADAIPIAIDTNVDGMNGLQSVKLDSISLPTDSPDGHAVVIAVNVSVYNPSVVSLTIGSGMPLCMSTLYLGSSVAVVNSSVAQPVQLLPGWSTYAMSGLVAPVNLTSASEFFSRYMSGLSSTVTVQALETCVPPELTWLRAVVNELRVTVNVSGLVGLELVQSVEINTLLMDFNQANYSAGVVAVGSGTITAYWKSPFTFPFDVYETSMNMNMFFANRPIAHLVLPTLASRSRITVPGSGTITVSFSGIPVVLNDFASFTDYVDALVLKANTSMGISGVAALSTAVSFGNASLNGIPFSQQVALHGVDSFHCDGCVSIQSVDLTGGAPGKGFFILNLNLRSEATASLLMGRLSVQIYYMGSLLGVGVVQSADLYVGNNSFVVHATLLQSSDNAVAVRAFFSNFVQGITLSVEMHGFANGTEILVAKRAFSQLNTTAIIPGSSERLVRYGQLMWSWKIFKLMLPVRLTIYNPYNSSIAITAASFIVSFKGKRVASVSVSWAKDPIIIRAQSIEVTRNIDASIDGVSIQFLRTLIGEIHISVAGTLSVSVGDGFQQILDYVQHDIPASFLQESPPTAANFPTDSVLLAE